MALPCKITVRFPKDIDQITEEGILWEKAGTTATANTVWVEVILNHSPLSRHVPSMACDVIIFNGPGQLCPLPCAEWSYLSNHARMSTIQSRTPDKNAKDRVTLNRKFLWTSCFTTHPPFLLSNPKILKDFLKTFPTKMKPKCPAKEKKRRQYLKEKKEGRRESEK